jgi:hypothetical protein
MTKITDSRLSQVLGVEVITAQRDPFFNLLLTAPRLRWPLRWADLLAILYYLRG